MVIRAEGFSVAPVEGDRPQSELLWEGRPTAIRVDGVTLEHQVQVSAGHLLFLTEDSPLEEGLHIYLLDRSRHVADGLELSAPYSAGTLRDVTPEADGAVSFSFFGRDRWRLAVSTVPLGLLARRISAPARRKSVLDGKPRLIIRRLE